MAENTRLSLAKVVSKDDASGKNPTRSQQNISNTSKSDLLSKEEEYKRLNEELEAKTASLVQEAEQVMKEQESVLAKSRLLDNINTDDFLKSFDDDLTERNEDMPHKTLSRAPSKASQSKQTSQKSGRKKSGSGRTKSRPGSKTSAVDDVALVDDTFITAFKDSSLYREALADIEDKMEGGDVNLVDDDVLPQAAHDMGSEATIRFLKAKVRVMQEELDRLALENNKKDEEVNHLKGKLKEFEEERGRLYRTNGAQKAQMEKFKKLAEDARSKSESQESQLTAIRKELDQQHRMQKQQVSTQSAMDVRLNRALEECEKYKEQLQKAKATSKDSSDVDKKHIEQLVAENKRLEKQKNELMAGFKKQMKLIDILKRQKMHIEAAKMLQFSEEEFVKALEWGS